ncbi:hypothetical protein OAory_01010560 [Aspergillus oryzae]|uniref:Uncharacterized protein n=1 Tax=Aspergillus oryzae TaxID=5062 RepID=A0A1S9DW65_ASPOZ|nr:hypothetical protein OAory_01010560 [Aspergillus oryzae]
MTFFTRLAFFSISHLLRPNKDTLLGAIYVNGTGVTPASVIKLLGDQGGSDPVSFQPDNFAIEFTAPDNADIEISYSLVNKHDAAGADGTKLINAIGTAIGAAGAATGTSSITSILVAVGNALGALDGLCDGAVAGQSIFLTPTDLQKLAPFANIDCFQFSAILFCFKLFVYFEQCLGPRCDIDINYYPSLHEHRCGWDIIGQDKEVVVGLESRLNVVHMFNCVCGYL